MSANNEAEPAAALAAAASSSAASAASASEYLKRTCLICGCQTNQTINIYEPRSGPNIVQLIQAKFKFQPLNEDKFLCFSCNNWLINWHSLQALNSNDAESGESRSQSPSHMGNNSSGALVQQRPRGVESLERAKLRPVAQVRPQPQQQQQKQKPLQPQAPSHAQPQIPLPAISYKRRRRTAASAARVGSRRQLMRLLPATTTTTSALGKRSSCRKCRESELSKWRALHRRSLAKVAQLQQALRRQQRQQRVQQAVAKEQALVKSNYQRMPAPRVDGKVVAMFRRLGTTLSSEQSEEQQEEKPRPLRIMSPAKQRPRWTRALDDDEILLEFDSGIFEVLPPAPRTATARRCLSYQLTSETAETETATEAETEAEAATHRQTEMKLAGLHLPQGLSITLI